MTGRVRSRVRIGDVEVIAIIDGEIPGPPDAMYAEVPAPERAAAVAGFVDRASGNFVFTIGSYLLAMPDDRLVLVDTGIGPNPVQPSMGGGLRSGLLAVGVQPEDVDDVVFTHLHFDHIGWAAQGGAPFFPNATYRADRRDWEHFMAPDYEPAAFEHYATRIETDRAGVRLAPVADRLELWDPGEGILPGLSSWDAPGHTPGTSALVIESRGERGALLGDIAHSIPELLNGWPFRSHLEQERATASNVATREWLADEGLLCSGSHFPGLEWGYVRRTGGNYTWEVYNG